MKISHRLQSLCDCIPKGAIVADIGCDHAQLCIHLVQNGKCQKAYACDINEGPLLQAQKNIEYYKLADCIKTSLSDGLADLNADVTHIVIAGMGFETIQQILDKDVHTFKKTHTFVVQANRDVPSLRQWISDHHFTIQHEFVVKEEEHYYQMVIFTCDSGIPLTQHEIKFGKEMKKDFNYYSMIKFRLSKLERVLRSLPSTNPKYQTILEEMFTIYKELGSK